jgi:hypothetical protein
MPGTVSSIVLGKICPWMGYTYQYSLRVSFHFSDNFRRQDEGALVVGAVSGRF